MAMLDWNRGGKKTAIPGLTPQEQEDIDAQIETANQDAFVPPNVELQFSPATPTKGLTRREQTVAESRSPSETLRLREEQRRDAWHKSNMKARQSRLESMLATEGGRYSPITIRRAQVELDRLQGGGIPGLRAHELAVADKGIEQERVKAWGMANQGGVAAGIKAGVERDANRAQHGYFDENGNYVPGSTVRAAEATGLSREEIARINNEGRWNVANANNETRKNIAEGNNQTKTQIAEKNNQTQTDIAEQNNQTRKEVGASHDQARRDAAGLQQQRADQNARNRIVQDIQKGAYIMSGMSPEKWKSLSPEEQQAYINGLMPNQPNNNNTQQPPARRSWRDRYGAANK